MSLFQSSEEEQAGIVCCSTDVFSLKECIRLGEFAGKWQFLGGRAGLTHGIEQERSGPGEEGTRARFTVRMKLHRTFLAFPETCHRGQLSTEGICRQKEKLFCQEEEKSSHKKRLFLCEKRWEPVVLLAP